MEQHIPQEEIRRIIISDTMKKSKVVVSVIVDDTTKNEDNANKWLNLHQELINMLEETKGLSP